MSTAIAEQMPDGRARKAVAIGISIAFIGSIFGFVFGVLFGPVSGTEAWLISSCIVVSGVLLGLLAHWPASATSDISAVACVYFTFYLCTGIVLTAMETVEIYRVLPYLLFFYPLLSFNKFTNFSRYSGQLDRFIALAPAGLLIGLAGLVGEKFHRDAIGTLAIFLLTYTSYAMLLSLFSRYREALVVGIARASEAERTTRALGESEERFRRVFDESGTGTGALDLDGRIQWANRVFAELVGMSEPMAKMMFVNCLQADDRERWKTLMSNLAAHDRSAVSFEGQLAPRGGRTTYISCSFILVDALGSLPQAIIFTCQDVTEKRDLNDRLRQTQKLEAIGQLTGGIAHDFNNLLTVILGNTESLIEGLAHDPALRGLAEVTEKAAERAAELTSRLLSFARRQPLDPKPVDISRQIAGMDQLLRRTLGEHIHIAFVHAPDLSMAVADPGQLENAILNLCINARDAMSEGGQLTIEAANVNIDDASSDQVGDITAGKYVMIAVTDTGEGMSADTLHRVFEPFFTTKDVGKGSGLGLSMVHGFIKQSRGHVSIKSEIGRGTVVKLYLPRHEYGVTAAPMPS